MSTLPLEDHILHFNALIGETLPRDTLTEEVIKQQSAKLTLMPPPSPGSFCPSPLLSPHSISPDDRARHERLLKMLHARQRQVDRWKDIVSTGRILAARLDRHKYAKEAREVRQRLCAYEAMLESAEEDLQTRLRLYNKAKGRLVEDNKPRRSEFAS